MICAPPVREAGEAHGTLAPSTVNYHPFPHESQLPNSFSGLQWPSHVNFEVYPCKEQHSKWDGGDCWNYMATYQFFS